MTVLSPLLLLASVVLAVPILIHLLRRREKRTLVFPALRYLKRTTREHARIVRLRQLLLLALRIMAVLLAVLAGARLVLPLGGRDDPPAGLAIIVDNGLTSGTVVGDGRLLDSLLVRASEALERAGPRDQVWVIAAGAPQRASVPLSVEGARAALAALTPTHVTPNLVSSLARAADLLNAAAPEMREIVLVSDLRPAALQQGDPGMETQAERLIVAPPPAPPPSNRGIADLLVAGGVVPRAGDLAEIQIYLSGSIAGGSAVRGYLEGRFIGTSLTGADGAALLTLPRLPVGWVEGRVEVEPDDLRGDDIVHFAFQTIPPPTVQTLGGTAPFVDEALSVLDEAGRVRLVEEGPAMVQLVSAASLGSPADDAAVILVPPDEAALLPSLNQELGRLLPGWRLEAAPRAEGAELVVDGGALAELLPSEPSIREAYSIRIPEDADDWSELLILSNGAPWLVASESAGRPIFVLASPMSAEASDLPVSASMLPLMEFLTGRAPGSAQPTHVAAGEPFTLPDGAATVRLPDGTGRPASGPSIFRDTEMAGVYDVLGPDDSVIAKVAVNAVPPDPGEGLATEEAVALLSGTWPEAVAGEPWPGAVLRDRNGREVARPLLLALLLVLIAEGWLASAGRRASGATNGPVANPAP